MPPDTVIDNLLAGLPRPLYTLAIASTDRQGQWGSANFSRLASALAARGCGVAIVGGTRDAAMARAIVDAVEPPLRGNVVVAVGAGKQQWEPTLRLADANIGNHGAISHLAAALGRPSHVLLGDRRLPAHDPLMRMVLTPNPNLRGDRHNRWPRKAVAAGLERITVADVLAKLESDPAIAPHALRQPLHGAPLTTYIDCSGMRLGDRMACCWWAQLRHERTGQRFGLLDLNLHLREMFDLAEFFPQTFQAVTRDDVERDGLDRWNQGPLWLTARNEFGRHPAAGHFEFIPQDIREEARRLREQSSRTRPRVLLHILDDAPYNRARNWNAQDTQALLGQLKSADIELVVLNPTRGQFLGGYRRLLAEMQAADVYIGGDTGPSHVWAMLCPDKPQLVIHPEDSHDQRRWSIVQHALGLPLPWNSLPLRDDLQVFRMVPSKNLKVEFGKFGIRKFRESRFSAAEVVAGLHRALRSVETADTASSDSR